ncbi:calcium-binding protein [Rhodopirellula halodulae]|uniref:calcium-binding protein n=1 Tax=Rhodopirellula halodulae TaxID=2894198 RepID=UPI001E34B2C3|nr:calcium-binding protein [Rhodopirellula sp. JC737]
MRGGNDVVVVEQDLAIPATVFGSPGDDYISGGAADDFLFGDSPDAPGGKDTILGNRGNDWLDGGDADDLLRGGFGEDELFGGNGDDDLRGEHDADALYGGPGNDSLEGGFDGEQDVLEGGRGVDTFFSKYIKLVWKYRKRYNRLTRQWEYSKTKTPEILEADTVSDLDANAGDQVKATIIEG